jgi:3-oxoacyl-[acyl-carrier protein] reductase
MQISLQHKTALVGGATSGIGKAIALQLASSGAHVILMSRNLAKLKEVRALLDASLGQEHQIMEVDFTDFEGFREKITASPLLHQVDILVNNTQGPEAGNALEKTSEDYQQAFDLLFQAAVFTTLQVLPGMRKRNFGRIINVSSRTVKEPLSHLVLSNSIRSALVSWSKTLSREIASQGITVNNILTGYFDTERLNALFQGQSAKLNVPVETIIEQAKNQVPAKRFGDPAEFAYLVSFLASQQAAYITGTNIPIDGGMLQSF